jgi:hypothetical protein
LNKLGILFLGVGLPLTEMSEDFINSKTTMRMDDPCGGGLQSLPAARCFQEHKKIPCFKNDEGPL